MTDALHDKLIDAPALTLGRVPDGYQAMMLSQLCRMEGGRLVFIARDGSRIATLKRSLAFFAPDITLIDLPAWDCLPYDRLSPQVAVSAARMAALSALAGMGDKPHIVLTTISAACQKMPPRAHIARLSFHCRPGQVLDVDALTAFLAENGYARCSTVLEPGDYALRGGIIDLFAPGADAPVRLDLFGDTLESIRSFDAETQRTTGQLQALTLTGAGEVLLDSDAVQRFRRGYVAAFGTVMDADPLYEAISGGARYPGMEHWLPLFYDGLETLFDHCGDALFVADAQMDTAYQERMAQISDYYQARADALEATGQDAQKTDRMASSTRIIKPLAPEQLYILADDWAAECGKVRMRRLDPFTLPEAEQVVNLDGEEGYRFAAERAQQDVNLFAAVVDHVETHKQAGRRIVLTGWSDGSTERLTGLLRDHGLDVAQQIASWQDVQTLPPASCAIATIGLEHGFVTQNLAIITEQDILGDRMVRPRNRKRAENFLTEASSLSQGDHVVHVEHGIGRFEGLQTIDVGGAPHDCLKLVYHGDARLFLPVENIDLLSRFGGDDVAVALDRLGGTAWQMRKSRLKEKLKLIAEQLIKTAAARAMRKGEKMLAEPAIYDGFCSRFPYEETDDQLDAIAAVMDDLSGGRPMDRLICGDVGFGKTEVALRAAFIAAMSGKQVAVVAPTTLLARQHGQTFKDRFAGLPVQIGELSRLVGSKEAADTKAGLADGQVDIVIGTHALLSKNIAFDRLGLVVIDEEQHFGVAHKERLKELRAEVHVLTLTATPIPRTLQMALSGVRDLSLIATPPVDRLAVRTYVTPFDAVGIREALLREKFRNGQSFIIVPRISDIEEMVSFLNDSVPEVRFITAHGQMSGGDLESRMTAFYEARYDVLVSTSIIESGLDIPTANTIVIHRADMFGLAQLYQMRGRVGRSKTRAFAYLTYNENKPLTENAEKRLKVMQSLDSLGAGFNLASYDLDLRGAGNLVGEEQSGHVKEVGYELYQSMLEEAVAQQQGVETEESWSPQINAGISVLIPDSYIPDLDIRMGLYRRLSSLGDSLAIDALAAEIIDRFGALPEEVRHLLAVLEIKLDCLAAGIEKMDAGPKGVAVFFRNLQFANPEKLIAYVTEHQTQIKIRPDQSLVFRVAADTDDARLQAARRVARQLAELAAA